MIYSNLYVGEKPRIPTFIGILVIVFVVGFFLSLTNRSVQPTKATKSNLKRVEVANLNPIQVSIFWQGQAAEEGWIVYGEEENKLSNIALDDRDIATSKGKFLNHFSTLKNLKPDKVYFFAIIAANQKIVAPDGRLFSFKTPLESAAKTKLNPATGKALNQNLTPLENAVVLINIDDNTSVLATLTKSSGEWLIPLNSFYDKKLLQEKTFTGNEEVKLEILSESGMITSIQSDLNFLAGNSETTVIGKNYNFLDENVLSAVDSLTENTNEKVDIIYPQEGALIPGRRPLIKGQALPSTRISITINSEKTYSAVVSADLKGSWSYLIPEDLDLGEHTITVKVEDPQGGEKILLRKFTIVANEGNDGKVLGEASGEPTITLTPTQEPTSPAATTSASTTPPVSGRWDFLPVIGGMALIIIGGGILLAL